MLEVKGVSKLYENQRGVREIDFEMSRGEIVGFLGPNGAGKTTTMRMITGYLNPTHGTIRIDGLSMADHPRKARRKIGYLPETPPLYPEMTVIGYLKFVADLRDVPAREQKKRIEEVVAKLGLQGRERQIIRSLSKGYKQRVGLAQAILHKPDLLVLDEPTSGLDPKQIIEIRELIKELGENHTVLLSTHILPEVNMLCNRVLIINQGRIVTDGRPDSIAQSLSDRFEVALEIKGPRSGVLAALHEMPEIGEVRELQSDEADAPADDAPIRVRVSSRDRGDLREALFYRMAERGYPILEMRRESLSLEDVFLKLTTDEPAAQADSGEQGQAAADAAKADSTNEEGEGRA
ncbi:ABC transporter ATP-binding protein [Paenibacillus thermoaerophilus]|uniref:ABC transporter ATP-binding protein n=1 Tax=Paenibacillus thermoaerophilus TaxID=1215385 RepID=A0ABW2V1S2_9BACL|nr:ATP-binding cassette domain-containing protein [Paenibacillus thermoaerophilus]TMV08250.1 ATP-binding cassette domain-containing protein [Paenibacillus thermoaerophilus]